MENFPTKSQLLLNFASCNNWQDRYLYIIDLGKMLPNFPNNMRTKKNLISGCQSTTWIALTPFDYLTKYQYNKKIVKFYGDSDAAIVKGIITIIFITYQGLEIKEIINFDPQPFLCQLQLQENLTISRSQGIFSILHTIQKQAKKLQRLNI